MLTGRDLSHKSTDLLSHAWREGTRKQYNSTVRRWGEYCCQRKIDSLTPPVNEVINFLSNLFEMSFGYGGIASARSALGNFVTIPGYPRLADHPLIQKLLKGIGNVRPPKPRYTMIWDTTLLIKYLASLNNVDLDFQRACWKTSALLTILSRQRVSTIHKFRVSNLQLTDNLAMFYVADFLKQSKPTCKPKPVVFHKYPHNEHLCPVRLVQVYMEKQAFSPLGLPLMPFFLPTGDHIIRLLRIPSLDG